jgi:hypothetical protein
MTLRLAVGCLELSYFVAHYGNSLEAVDTVGWGSILVRDPLTEKHLLWRLRAILGFDPDLDLEQNDYGSYHLHHCGNSHAPGLGPDRGLVLVHGRDLPTGVLAHCVQTCSHY